MKILYKKNRK